MIRNILLSLALLASITAGLVACEGSEGDTTPMMAEHVGDGETPLYEPCVNDTDCESGLCAPMKNLGYLRCYEDVDSHGNGVPNACNRPAKPDYGGDICNAENHCPASHECRYVSGPYSKCTPRCE